MATKAFRILSFSIALCLLLTTLQAQTTSTEILGTVKDQTGAVLPGVAVQATHVATGLTRTTFTNESGDYVFPLLEIGEYAVSAELSGFKKQIKRGIILQLNQKARIDFVLEIGEVTETVEVTASAPLLKTDEAALGVVIEHRRVVDLPLNGRNFGHLAVLIPGVQFGNRMGLTNGQGGFPIPGQTIAVSANGHREINQQITLDGVIATEPRVNTMTFAPSIDAIEEFKIQTGIYSAEYGHNSGAQVNVALKSGTNEFRGSFFEFLRNDALDARGFFLRPDSPKNKLRRNQYGFVLLGPIARDRTFFSVNYEGRRERRATPSRGTVPTVEFRQGDFSALTARIIDPLTGNPFPGNIIPQNRFSRAAVNLLQFMPLPNQPGPANFSSNSLTNIDDDQFFVRIDHKFGEKDKFMARYAFDDASVTSVPLNPNFPTFLVNRQQNVAIQQVHVFNPRVINEFRFGYNRVADDFTNPRSNTDFDVDSLGIGGIRVVGENNRKLTPREAGIPIISITGFLGLGDTDTGNGYDINEVWQFSDNFVVVKGRHTIKAGLDVRRLRLDRGAANLPRGRFTFTGDIANHPFAAFMLGFPRTSETAEGIPPLWSRQNRYGMYVLTDWKATQRLTLNLGLRYDLYGVVRDIRGRFRNLAFPSGEWDPLSGVIPELIPAPGVVADLYDVEKWHWMPRIGFAYRPAEKWVIRGGYGIFTNAQQINNFSILNLQPPFSGSNLFINPPLNPPGTLENPFAGAATDRPTNLLMLPRRHINNWHNQWSLELQRELTRDLVLSVGYVGNKGTHVDYSSFGVNNPPPGGRGDIQSRRPVQFYRDRGAVRPLGNVRFLANDANSWYHSLQARAEKRFSRGFTFLGAYTWSKALSEGGYGRNEGAGQQASGPQNSYDRRGDKGRYGFDVRHRLVMSYIWELPFARNLGGVAGALLRGWSFNGIVTFQTGFPVTIFQAGDRHNTGAPNQRPDLLPGAKLPASQRRPERWFNTEAFAFSTDHFGTSGVGILDGPGTKNFDLGIFKNFQIKERHQLQFRFELFNAFNTPQFGFPGNALGTATFGLITGTAIEMRELQFALKYSF